MNPEKWKQMKGLFATALEREPAQRSEFLHQACGDDEALRAELEQLLRSYELNKSVSIEESSATDEFVGRKIGTYQLIRKIGAGGMGAVYLAARADDTFNKRVAIKLVRGDVDTQAVLRRFRQERQILAPLDHPYITRLLDGGTTEQGLPYFVMDYVEGTRIDHYCDSHKLSINERIKLFREVCSAVQYVHQNLVVHRDLKPGNILVTADGVPKLLDFGIAKLLKPEFFTSSLDTTLAEFRPMTPGYASPEQVRGEPVTTASDVYSLGVILYELLTSCWPYKLRGDDPDEMRRAVCEQEPDKPSLTLTQFRHAHHDGDRTGPSSASEKSLTAESVAALRDTVPEKLRRQLSGDLDVIVLKALRKEPQRRYLSVAQLSDDLGRHLEGLPVMAHRDSRTYRAGKFIRRHKVGVAAAILLVLLVSGFAGLEAVQLRRIARERDRANRVSDFLIGMFKVSDPSEARGNSISAREILDRGSKTIDTGLAKDPDLQAQMASVMGKVYGSLGLYARAQLLLQETVNLRQQALGPSDPETLKSQTELAWILRLQGQYAESETMLRHTLDTQKRVLRTEDPDTIKTMSNLAVVLSDEGHFADAEAMFREVLDSRQRALGPTHTDTIIAKNNLATILFHENKNADAEKLYREVLEIRQSTLGPDHPYTLLSMNNLAAVLHNEGNYIEAEKLKRQTLDIRRRVLGPEHPDTLLSMSNLADALMRMHDYDGARNLLQQALGTQRRVLGPENPQTIISMTNLAVTLMKMGKYKEAETMLRSALEIQRRVLGPDHPDTASSMYSLAAIEAREGQRAEAISLLRDALQHGLAASQSKGIATDPDLNSLHGDPGFEALVADANKSARPAQAAQN